MKKLLLQKLSLIFPVILACGNISGMSRVATRLVPLVRSAAVQRGFMRSGPAGSRRLSSQINCLSSGQSRSYSSSRLNLIPKQKRYNWNWKTGNQSNYTFNSPNSSKLGALFGASLVLGAGMYGLYDSKKLKLKDVNISTIEELLERAKQDKEFEDQLITLAVNNISKIDVFVLESIIKLNPETAQLFTIKTLDNITDIDWNRLKVIMDHSSEVEVFSHKVIENITKINSDVLNGLLNYTRKWSMNPLKFIRQILSFIKQIFSEDKIKPLLIDSIAKNIDHIDPDTLQVVMDFYSDAKDILEVAIKIVEIERKIGPGLESTPTLLHVKRMGGWSRIKSKVPLNDPNFFRMLEEILGLEKKHKDECYTFVHGQRWHYHLLEKLYTDLWALKQHRSKQNNFMFAHVKKQDEIYGEERRKKLLENGASTFSDDYGQLLFMNGPFFGNLTDCFSFTPAYVIDNNNMTNISTTLGEVFAMHGYADIHKKYENEVQELEKLHKQSSKYGNLFFIAVPKDKINQAAYVTGDKGYKDMSYSDAASVCEALQKEDANIPDTVKFCLPMTSDMGMNHDSGIKVISVNAADQEKYKLFEQKYTQLMGKIKGDLGLGGYPIEELIAAYSCWC